MQKLQKTIICEMPKGLTDSDAHGVLFDIEERVRRVLVVAEKEFNEYVRHRYPLGDPSSIKIYQNEGGWSETK